MSAPGADLAERLLVTLHDRGGTLFDHDEVARTRDWLNTPDGAAMAHEYLAVADEPEAEAGLRRRIEHVIRS